MIIDTDIVSVPTEMCSGEVPLIPAHAGARVVFEGVVRDHDGGEGVHYLEYSAHPAAAKFLRSSVEKSLETLGNPQIDGIYVRHRVGHLEIGDVALLVVVDSAHRKEAFAVCAQIVDNIKASVPIWKDQYFADGHNEWSNTP